MSGRTLRRMLRTPGFFAKGLPVSAVSKARSAGIAALLSPARVPNCNLDLNNVASNCPDLLCEPQAGRAVSRNLQLEQTAVVLSR